MSLCGRTSSEGWRPTPTWRSETPRALAGVGSVTITYESVGGRSSAEVMELNGAGKVRRVLAHYTPSPK